MNLYDDMIAYVQNSIEISPESSRRSPCDDLHALGSGMALQQVLRALATLRARLQAPIPHGFRCS